MARKRHVNLFASCCLLASVWALYLTVSGQNDDKIAPPLARSIASVTKPDGASAESQGPEALNRRVEQLAKSLDEATAKLDTAMGRLESAQASGQSRRFSDEERVRQMAEITPPIESVQTAPDGRVTRNVAFEELIGVHGQILATAATFRGAYGRRLVFRGPDNQPLAFDVEELHPGVLAHLRIRLSDVTAAHQHEQENRRLRAEAANRRRLARARETEAHNAARPAAEVLPATSAQPSGHSTYITIQQPNTSTPNNYYPGYPYYGYSSHVYPVNYGTRYCFPGWSHGFHNPTHYGGTLASPPTTRQLPQVQAAMASGFRFNNTFKFNR